MQALIYANLIWKIILNKDYTKNNYNYNMRLNFKSQRSSYQDSPQQPPFKSKLKCSIALFLASIVFLSCPSVQQFSFEKTQVYSSSLFSGIETTLTISADLPASGTTSYESMNYFVVTLTDKSNGYFRVPANSEVFTCVSTSTGITILGCSYVSAGMFGMQIYVTIPGTKKLTFTMSNFVPIAPPGTMITDISFMLATQGQSLRAMSTGLSFGPFIAPLTLGPSYSLSPTSYLIGDRASVLQVSLMTQKEFPAAGVVQLVLPLWNPSDPDKNLHFISKANPVCKSQDFEGEQEVVTCGYDTTNNILTISPSFGSQTPAGSSLLFIIDSFINPYSGKARSGFTLRTVDVTSYVIENYQGLSIQVGTPAQFSQSFIVRVDDTTQVQELADVQIGLNLDFPIDAQCGLEIIFPNDIAVTADLVKIKTDGFLGVQEVTSITIQQDTNSVFIDACPVYSTDNSATLLLQKVVNPMSVHPSMTFKVNLLAKDTNGIYYSIAKIHDQLELPPPQPGKLNVSIQASKLNGQTVITFSILPKHLVLANSKIVITTDLLTLPDGPCTLSQQSQVFSDLLDCNVNGQEIVLDTPFADLYNPTLNGTLSFQLSLLESVTQSTIDHPVASISIFEVTQDGSSAYLIDQYTAPTISENGGSGGGNQTVRLMTAEIAGISNLQAWYMPVQYKFRIRPSQAILQNSSLVIEFPPEFNSDKVAFNSSTYQIKINQTLKFKNWKFLTKSPLAIQMFDMFLAATYNSSNSINITLEGVKNPRTQAQTQYFKVSFVNKTGEVIESITQGLSVQMQSSPNISYFSVNSTNRTNGAESSLIINVTSPVPVMNGDYMTIQFPQEVIVLEDLSCNHVKLNIILTCEKSKSVEGLVKVMFSNATGDIVFYPDLTFSFSLMGVKNPSDTRSTSSFSNIILYDSTDQYVTALPSGVYVGYKNLNATQIFDASMTQDDNNVNTLNYYDITYSTPSGLPSTAAFVVTVNDYVGTRQAISCKITVNGGDPKSANCSQMNGKTYTKKIKISSGGLIGAALPGDKITVRFGPLENPELPVYNKSFSLVSYVNDSYTDQIERINQGLSPAFKCQLPCIYCSDYSSTYCTGCITISSTYSNLKFLHEGQCLLACPDGYYSNQNKTCIKCPEGCLTCTSQTNCTSCDADKFNFQASCISECPLDSCRVDNFCYDCNYVYRYEYLNISGSNNILGFNSNIRLNMTLQRKHGSFQSGSKIQLEFPAISIDPDYGFIQDDLKLTYDTDAFFAFATLDNPRIITINIGQVMAQTLPSVIIQVGPFRNPFKNDSLNNIIVSAFDGKNQQVGRVNNYNMTGFQPNRRNASVQLRANTTFFGIINTLLISYTSKLLIPSGSRFELLVPFQNPGSEKPSQMLSSKSTCKFASIITEFTKAKCSYDVKTRILTVTNVAAKDIPIGTSFYINVTQFLNPYNADIKNGFVFSVIGPKKNFLIEEGKNLSVQATRPFLNMTGRMAITGPTTVGVFTDFQLNFSIPLTVDMGCLLRVQFPSDYRINADSVVITGGSAEKNFFIQPQDSSEFAPEPQADSANQIDISGCYRMAEFNESGSIILGNIINRGYVQGRQFNLSIELYDIDDEGKLVQLGKTSFRFPVESLNIGTIETFKIQPLGTLIGQKAAYQISLKPESFIPNDGNMIKIIFPSEIELDDQFTCSLLDTDRLHYSNCSVNLNELTIQNILPYIPSPQSQPLSFKFSPGGINPNPNCHFYYAKNFTVKTFAYFNGTYYPINSKSIPWAQVMPNIEGIEIPAPEDLMLLASVTPSSLVTSDSQITLNFDLQAASAIEAGSVMLLQIPDDLIFSTVNSVPSCFVSFEGNSTQGKVQSGQMQKINWSLKNFVKGTGYLNFLITDLFKNVLIQANRQFNLACGKGFQNPRFTGRTKEFAITIFNKQICPYSSTPFNSSDKFSFEYTETPALVALCITPSGRANGEINNYKVEFSSPIALVNNDTLNIVFPRDIIVQNTFTCRSLSPNLATISCKKNETGRNSQVIQASFTFNGNGTLESRTLISFNITQVKNPISLDPVSIKNVTLSQNNSLSQIIASFTGEIVIQNTQVSSFNGSLSQGSAFYDVASDYNISYTTVNPLPQGVAFHITFPPEISLYYPLINVSMTVQTVSTTKTPATYQLTVTKLYFSNSILVADNSMNSSIPSGSKVTLAIKGLINPILYYNITASITAVSYSSSSMSGTIDVIGGMIPQFACDYPCGSCPTGQRKVCNSCLTKNTNSYEKYFHQNTCLSVCPVGFYKNEQTFNCTKCLPDCLSCADGNSCLACNTSTKSKYRYSFNNRCHATCPKGFFSDANFVCQKCALNCATCIGSEVTCTSCPLGLSLSKKRTCVEQCEANQVAINQVCETCKIGCTSCVGKIDQCLGCTASATGYMVGSKCGQTACPEQFKLDQERKVCLGCDANCQKGMCTVDTSSQGGGSPSTCNQCKKGFLLFGEYNICITQCPSGYASNGARCVLN